MTVMQLFPVPVYSEQLSLDLPEIEKYSQELKKRNETARRSNRGGWQSEPLVGKHPPLNDLRDAIYKHGEEYRKTIGYKSPFEIKGMWVNVNGYKDYNVEHTHPHCIVSGCFFIKVSRPEFAHGLLELLHPSIHLMNRDWAGDDLFEFSQFNNPQLSISPVPNQLIFFPSWLVHSVSQNLSKKDDRISISFNLG